MFNALKNWKYKNEWNQEKKICYLTGKGSSGRLVGFHRDSTCGFRKTSNAPVLPASSSGHRRHRQASENFDKVFVAGGGSSVAASTPPSTKRDPSITSSSSSSGLMTLTTASSGSSKWSLGSKPPDYHQLASNRSGHYLNSSLLGFCFAIKDFIVKK